MATPKVVASRGDDAFLVDIGDGLGVVVEESNRVAFPPLPLQSILARGYWEEWSGPPIRSDAIIRLLETGRRSS